MNFRPLVLMLAAAITAAGCSTPAGVTAPSGGTLIPNSQLAVSPKTIIPAERLVYWAGVAALAYYVTDPLAPNWSIQEAKFPQERYHLSLQMKRYYVGGAGEARVVFQRRARELMYAGGFESFQVLEYSEGMDSSVIGSQRVAEGVVAMVGRGAAAP